jgi:signal transduction histidine kinase
MKRGQLAAISTPVVHVSVNDAETPFTVRFDVTDTGAGLSEAELTSLFQPMADTVRAGGGLGLAIARRLAEAMGGEAGCDSVPGQGSLYWFTFRSVAAEEENAVEGEQGNLPPRRASCQAMCSWSRTTRSIA